MRNPKNRQNMNLNMYIHKDLLIIIVIVIYQCYTPICNGIAVLQFKFKCEKFTLTWLKLDIYKYRMIYLQFFCTN